MNYLTKEQFESLKKWVNVIALKWALSKTGSYLNYKDEDVAEAEVKRLMVRGN